MRRNSKDGSKNGSWTDDLVVSGEPPEPALARGPVSRELKHSSRNRTTGLRRGAGSLPGSLRKLLEPAPGSLKKLWEPPAPVDPKQLTSRYRIVRTLATGTSAVHVVRRQDDARLLVLKVCRIRASRQLEHSQDLTRAPARRSQVCPESAAASRELALLRSLRHASIVRVHDSFVLGASGASPSRLCLVMDYAAGGDLQQLINRLRAEPAALPATPAGKPATQGMHDEQCTRILVQLISAATHCHAKGVVHRDIKPANIFLARAPNAASLVFLGDFGISAPLPTAEPQSSGSSASSLARSGQLAGTPYYLAPELLTGAPFSAKSDVWSIGVVLYQMLTLELPFVADSLPQLALKIQCGLYEQPRGRSAELLHVLRSCLTGVRTAPPFAPVGVRTRSAGSAAPAHIDQLHHSEPRYSCQSPRVSPVVSRPPSTPLQDTAARANARAVLNLPALAEWRRYYAARRLRAAADHYLSPSLYTPPARAPPSPRGWLAAKSMAAASVAGAQRALSPARWPAPANVSSVRPLGRLGENSIPARGDSPRRLEVQTGGEGGERGRAGPSLPDDLPLEDEAAVLEMRECLSALQELAQGEWLVSDRHTHESERSSGTPDASHRQRTPLWRRIQRGGSPRKADARRSGRAMPRSSRADDSRMLGSSKELYVQRYTPEGSSVSSGSPSSLNAPDGASFDRGVAVFLCRHNHRFGRLYVTGAHVVFRPFYARKGGAPDAVDPANQPGGGAVIPLHRIQCVIRSAAHGSELTLMLAAAAEPASLALQPDGGQLPTTEFRVLCSSSRTAAVDAIVAAVAAHGLKLSVYVRRQSSPARLRRALESYQTDLGAPDQLRRSFEALWNRSGCSDITSRLSSYASAPFPHRISVRRTSERDIVLQAERNSRRRSSRADADEGGDVQEDSQNL